MASPHQLRGHAAIATVLVLGTGGLWLAGGNGTRAVADTRPTPAGGASACASCHAETRELPGNTTFDAPGIYPYGSAVDAFDGGRRVPLLAESIDLQGRESEETCLSCHVPHDRPGFAIDLKHRVENMGFWANVKPSPAGTLHIEVKVRNQNSGHLAPSGRIGGAYVVTVEARQHQKPLDLRFGSRLWPWLRDAQRDAGIVFGRDFRDAAGEPTSSADAVAMLRADTRLESGRFQTMDFMFDRIDNSRARIDAVLWYLPDSTTWEGARAVRRADKPEPAK